MTNLRIACVHSGSEKATQSFADLSGRYEFVLPEQSDIIIENLDPHKRPLAATADFKELFNVASVAVREDPSITATLLFDPDRSLEERVTAEQFAI